VSGYGRGAIQPKPKPNASKGLREYHGPCQGGCGQTLHTLGSPPRKLCVECVDKGAGGTHLPEGRTCSECLSYKRCAWAPSRFRLPEAPAQTEEATP
jgi:hypothetical protein